MGLGNRFKKALGINKDKDNESSSNNSYENLKTDETPFSSNENRFENFDYLNNLIHSGSKEVVLDSEIVYTDGYAIFVDVEGLVINGNGHSIDGKSQSNILNITGKNITIENLTFKNGFSQFKGGAIINWGEVTFKNCKFIDNSSNDSGGAIFNNENCILKIIDTDFINNNANKSGGAIENENNSTLEINNSNFINNNSKRGGALYNQNKLIIKGGEFRDNTSTELGGAIESDNNSILEITGTVFKNNISENAGAIGALGNMNLNKCKFVENKCNEAGGAIFNQNNATIIDTEFDLNKAESGGAIANTSKINLKDSKFSENDGGDGGGAIFNAGNGILEIDNVLFSSNYSYSGAAINNEGNDINAHSCMFCKNISKKNVINNKTSLKLFNPKIYENNSSDYVIYNNDGSKLSISDGKIANNNTNITAINNLGECTIHKTIFKNNSSDGFGDIVNESNLTLSKPQFKDNIVSILNKGHIDAYEIEFKLEDIIDNEIGDIWDDSNENEFNFDYLNNLILDISNEDKTRREINLENDITLGNNEFRFFEGGIELDVDDLIINGNGKIIDGKNKTRIFNIMGKNITLKNIIFKNGSLKTEFENHTNGGGAIRIVKDGSLTLQDCQFIDNHSDDDGGAIQNNGLLNSKNNRFNNNDSEFYGGAIINNGILNSQQDEFIQNMSKLGCAIYNNYQLILKDRINLSDNNNDFNFIKAIYNANYIKTDLELNFEEDINNTCEINSTSNEYETFSFLNEKIRQSAEVILKKDIKFDYKTDYELIKGINISNDLIIDGNGYSIDGNHISSLFNIKDGKIVLKNIIFKNCYSNTQAIIENESDVTIDKCKFVNNKTAYSLIDNQKELNIINVDFYNNYSKNKSLINNEFNLKINESDFLNNDSNINGACLTNNKSKTATLTNSKFRLNTSKKSGGAIYNQLKATVNISNNEFHANTSGFRGGAIYNAGNVNLKDSVINHNSANHGGAIASEKGNLKIVNVKFNYNNSDIGGAITHEEYLSLNKCIFVGNDAQSIGGAIFSYHESISEIIDTQFSECKSRSLGGAITSFGRGYLKNNEFKYNIAGAGGAINIQKNSNLELDNNIFFANAANKGGAINNGENSSLKVLNSEFNSNIAQEGGGAIWSFKKERLNISNCRFIDNAPNDII